MKLKHAIISLASGLSISVAANAHAEVLQYLTFTVTTYTQKDSTNNGTNTITAAPKVQTHNTAELLSILARDKAAQHSWPSNSFPAGAKLAVGNDAFVVVAGTNILLNVSDILSFSNGDNEIVSGKRNDLTGLANPTTSRLQIGRLTFDDTAINGGAGLKFYLQGLLSQTESDTVPVNSVYTRTRSAKLSNGTGEGTNSGGRAFVLTGSLSATGRGKSTLAQ